MPPTARPAPRTPLVVGLSGSPRKNGNTDILVQEALKGAKEAGASVKFVRLADLEIAPCNACYGCGSGAGCVRTDDDMPGLYELLEKADAWVLGTPVYWFTMSAQLKTPLDRLFAFSMDPKGAPTKGKRAAVITVSGDADAKAMGEPIFKGFEQSFEFLGVTFTSRMALQGVARKEAKKRWAAFAPARRIGARLARHVAPAPHRG